MNYIINLLKTLKEIIITYLIEYLIIIISCAIYIQFGKNNINYFIYTYSPYILILTNILIIIYLYKKHSKKEIELKNNNYLIYISIGVSISCLLNMIIFKLNNNTLSNSTISPILLFISSGLIGPILEEILFRYINYNKLKEFNSPKVAIIINSLIFALIHINIEKIFFALILGIILNVIYEQKKNIIFPIIIHISANSIALLLNKYSPSILLLSIILLIITIIDYKHQYKSWQIILSII